MRISDWISECALPIFGAFGKLTTLSNTAGIIHGAMIQDETIEGWSKMIAVNQTALFLGLKIVAPEIAKSGNGAILNHSSLVDGKRVVTGKHVLVRVECGGGRIS